MSDEENIRATALQMALSMTYYDDEGRRATYGSDDVFALADAFSAFITDRILPAAVTADVRKAMGQ